MEWIEARISTTAEGVEPVFGVLLSCGVQGARIVDDADAVRFLNAHPLTWDYLDESLLHTEGVFVIFYVPPTPEGRETLDMVMACLDSVSRMELGFPVGDLTVTREDVNDEDWLHEWKKYYKPFRIGRSVVVCPSWEAYDRVQGDVVFTQDPGSVFGTGLHQTTQLCVEALEKYVKPGQHVLDIGCGSGILSVVALLLGAGSAAACDIDSVAAAAARDNAKRNGVDASRYRVHTGNILEDTALCAVFAEEPGDIVLANIVADVVILLMDRISVLVKPGGLFIASGIIADRVSDVASAFAAVGLTVKDTTERNGWYCMVCHA